MPGIFTLHGAQGSAGESLSTRDPPPPQISAPQSIGRNLVVCIDGTSNKFSEKNTNVVELYSHVVKNELQLTYYNSGIGTYAKPSITSPSRWKKGITSKYDAMFASHLEKVIVAAYRWLSDHYQPEDKIYLFGFSRGAYQIRALAAMIDTVGLIFPGNQEQIPFAFALYAKSGRDPGHLSRLRHHVSKVSVFKRMFSRQGVTVHFVGAWDTVSSVASRWGSRLPGTNLCKHIAHFRHALALDECRVKFLPEHTYDIEIDDQHAQEVWFPGDHSDVGRGDYSLIWMMREARNLGLQLDYKNVGISITHEFRVSKSPRWYWMPLELVPFSRPTPQSKGKTTEV
ncbi:hypothetical protein BDV93DRAFT_494065 [Ceratobasidium sp. AG-I]|nr:hypothetical protein BDV93DRAFT_494065 [Ceratobasidium sp. AG-I]